MKLRRNSMSPLRFDRTGALNPICGIDSEHINATTLQLAKIRDEMMSGALDLNAGNAFVRGPDELLASYAADRRGSVLGRLFKRASYMHTIVDRVVLLGSGACCTGAKAILESCCQPFWNELSRADRGSKPRIYFDGNSFDNDSIQGLLHLLDAHKGKPASSELERWALVVIDKNGDTPETWSALRQFLAALQTSTGLDREKLVELLVPVTGQNSRLRETVTQLGSTDIYPIPEGVDDPFSVLSVAGLVPAAMLGVNVIELLQGAVAMTEHFATAPPQENVVLQFAATNHLLEKKRVLPVRVLRLWSKALEPFGFWYDQLVSENLGNELAGVTQMSMVKTSDLFSRHQQHQHAHRDTAVNNIIVEEVRFDALPVQKGENDVDFKCGASEETLPQALKRVTAAANEELKLSGRPSTNLFVPRVDELHMGQLFQMMMLATAVEGRFMGFKRAVGG
ncbi:MAG: glucose-6-phosphate isomerase [Planctomycetota bacterium]|nr:glucose-6-phosphate isomerase [Planctomycetota bacterium]